MAYPRSAKEFDLSLQRLKKLRDVMASAKPLKGGGHVFKLGKNQVLFDIGDWGYKTSPLTKRITGCETAACVIGTAGLIPEFQKQGLMTDPKDSIVRCGTDEDSIDQYAFAEFFFADNEEAFDVCFPDSYEANQRGEYVEPKHVVEKLDQLIKQRCNERPKKKKA